MPSRSGEAPPCVAHATAWVGADVTEPACPLEYVTHVMSCVCLAQLSHCMNTSHVASSMMAAVTSTTCCSEKARVPQPRTHSDAQRDHHNWVAVATPGVPSMSVARAIAAACMAVNAQWLSHNNREKRRHHVLWQGMTTSTCRSISQMLWVRGRAAMHGQHVSNGHWTMQQKPLFTLKRD